MTPSTRRISIRNVAACVAAAVVLGCQGPQSLGVVEPPGQHSVRADDLLLLSDFKLSGDHELIRDLKDLRSLVSGTLELPAQGREVVVYLFSTETEYIQYLNATYPGLPNRRAYFVGTPRELAVYTYWGQRIQEDLRHEYTHGILHASLKRVPLWLDEGLAEYFEVPGPTAGAMNSNYPKHLRSLVADGWRPDLRKLEALEEFASLQQVHYQEAWAWVHFLLHGSDETRAVLLSYLADLRTDPQPRPLSARLKDSVPHVEDRFLAYLTELPIQRR